MTQAQNPPAKKTPHSAATQQSAEQETPAQQPPARKRATKKSAAKQSTAGKASTRKAATQKTSPKKPATQKTAAKRTPAAKSATKQTPARKTTATKSAAARKPAAKTSGAQPSSRAKKTSPAADVSSTTARPRREHDLVLFGATGFTGQLVAKHLIRTTPASLRIALAGRSEGKLGQVVKQIGGRAYDLPLVIANSDDPRSLAAMAQSTTALITTVGPYAKYGLPLVGACADAGTNYCDLTGEVLFMRDSIDRYDAKARSTGARIVHSCGFDSIPSDLGVLALSMAIANDDADARMLATRLVVRSARGGISGGTIASGMLEAERARGDERAREVLDDPYSLSPDRAAEPTPGDDPDPRSPLRDELTGTWLTPFLMGSIKTRVVRRSNALQDYRYGRQFRYSEYLSTGGGPGGRLAATGIATAMAAGEFAMSLAPARDLLQRFLPDPGEGPSERTRAKGYFSILLHTRTNTGVQYRATVAAQGDPGYAATSMMLATSGLTLAGTGLTERAGVLTPATAMGETLITNLKAAGMTIEAARA